MHFKYVFIILKMTATWHVYILFLALYLFSSLFQRPYNKGMYGFILYYKFTWWFEKAQHTNDWNSN
jgi:hypothetical protein